ncbi:MFS transporter [Kineosporia succinea]|uniref:Fucose permease n=1 Tax=Kineosporia succinea TaxID=84632 RepID=A0ABT9P384_9ACTN|nr:MFS transporter [Kineosporia succinea]MDP9827155.1 fucose permease [Kineosporia succinea]
MSGLVRPAPLHSPARISSAKHSVAIVFALNGLVFSSWSARLPAVRDQLDLSVGRIGLVLLALSAGSLVMLPSAGAVISALGPARTVLTGVLIGSAGVVAVGLAPDVWLLAAGLFLTGAGMGAWDVAMNVEGAEVERRIGRVVMPRFHAAYSLGTVGGAGSGALAAALDVSPRVHLPLVALVVLIGGTLAQRRFVALPGETEDGAQARSRVRSVLAAWAEPKTLLIGALVFSMALAEGAANDWLALAVVDGYGAPHALGAGVFAVFVIGMTVTRMAGPALLERVENARALRISAVLVLLGSGLVISGTLVPGPGAYPMAVVGALLWGVGAALGFPMGMTAAAADPVNSAARVGVVSTIGYTAFIAGPPVLGAVGQQVGVALSLAGVSLAVLLALITAGAVRSSR